MYYSDHLAFAEKDVTSKNFCCLVDTAVKLYEEQEQERKGNMKKTIMNLCDSNDMSFFNVFPRKPRTPLKKHIPKRPPFSSASLFAGDYKITPASVTRNPQNPSSSCLTESKSRERRVEQEINPNTSKCKKLKVEGFSWIGRETPEWLNELMSDVNGTELCLIFERSLYKTDVNPSGGRLSMPFNELIKKDFLTPVESRIIREVSMGAILFDEEKVKWGVMLKRWDMKRDCSGSGSWKYVLTCGWNDVVEANELKVDDRISIWSFRLNGVLCFALVTPLSPPSMAEASSSSASALSL